MIKNIEYNLKTWDWKIQTIETDWLPVTKLIWRIERWDYKTKKVTIDLNIVDLTSYHFECNNLFEFMTHYKLVENANLDYPVILNRKWVIVDWRHRLAKAILQWKKKLKWIMVINSDIYE